MSLSVAAVECPICLKEFRDPRILSCGHTFCLQCIDELPLDAGILKCPKCRQGHAGYTAAADLPKNFTACDLIEEMRRMINENEKQNEKKNENEFFIVCTECKRNSAIQDQLFCTTHNAHVCPTCRQLKHEQCDVVNAVEHASKALLKEKELIENAQLALDRCAERCEQDTIHSIARLKLWTNALNKTHELYEQTRQLFLDRLHALSKEVSSHKGLLADVLANDVMAATFLYSGNWANADGLLAKCAVYSEVDLVKLAGFAEKNIVRRIGNHSTRILPELDDELLNMNVDQLVSQIKDQLDQIPGGHTTNPSFNCEIVGTNKQSLCLVRNSGPDRFIMLNESLTDRIALSPVPEGFPNRVSVTASKGKIYAIGGRHFQTGDTTDAVWMYDAPTGAWQELSPMLEERISCGAAVLYDRVFAVGGGNDACSYLRSVEQLDSTTGRWVAVASLSTPRDEVCVAVLGNMLFALGGYVWPYSYLKSAELYDPRAGTWTSTACMNHPRTSFSCAVLGDRLYVAGGFAYYPKRKLTASVECFDLKASRWTYVADMSVPRSNFTLVVLNGQLLAVGGRTWNSDRLYTVEVYNEQKDAWTTQDIKLRDGDTYNGFVLEF